MASLESADDGVDITDFNNDSGDVLVGQLLGVPISSDDERAVENVVDDIDGEDTPSASFIKDLTKRIRKFEQVSGNFVYIVYLASRQVYVIAPGDHSTFNVSFRETVISYLKQNIIYRKCNEPIVDVIEETSNVRACKKKRFLSVFDAEYVKRHFRKTAWFVLTINMVMTKSLQVTSNFPLSEDHLSTLVTMCMRHAATPRFHYDYNYTMGMRHTDAYSQQQTQTPDEYEARWRQQESTADFSHFDDNNNIDVSETSFGAVVGFAPVQGIHEDNEFSD